MASATRESKKACDLKDKVRAGSKKAVLALCQETEPVSLSALIESVYPDGDVPFTRFDLLADGFAEWAAT
jgi:hypothetical protein